MKLTRQEYEQLRRRVSALEAVLTPELRREADLIRKAEFVVDVAKAEGMLPADYNGRELYALSEGKNR